MSSWMNGIYFFLFTPRPTFNNNGTSLEASIVRGELKRPVGFTSRIRLTLVFMSGRGEQISGTISVGSGWRVSSESLIWGGGATSCLRPARRHQRTRALKGWSGRANWGIPGSRRKRPANGWNNFGCWNILIATWKVLMIVEGEAERNDRKCVWRRRRTATGL